MAKVVFDISMSLDGFMRAANARPDEPLGDGGERLHEWAFGADERSSELLAEAGKEIGAVVCGRNTYDDSIRWWEPTARPARPGWPCSWSPTASPGSSRRTASTGS